MKYAGDRGDPYLDKDSGVLRNLLGIKNQADLDIAESSLSFLRTNELRDHPVVGNVDLKHLQAIHQCNRIGPSDSAVTYFLRP